MGDEIHRVIARHVLLLQEVGSVTFTFREDRDQHIRAGNFVAARALNVKDGALDHALEARRGLRVGIVFRLERLIFLVEILPHDIAQFGHVHPAGIHHLARIGIVHQCQQQVFQRCVFVIAVGRMLERRVQRFF